MLDEETTVKKIKEVIRKLRPYLNSDGGDLEFVKYEEGIVYIHLLGACVGCASSNDTIQNSVEAMLLEEVPGVIGVENIETPTEDAQ
jgi:Fe-S cluster biogenesis protein NfuA